MNEPTGNHADGPPALGAGPSPRPLSLGDRVRSLRMPDQPPPRSGGSWLPWLLCLALLGGCGVLGYFVYQDYLFQQELAAGNLDVLKERAPKVAEKLQEQSSGGSPQAVGGVGPGEVALESKGYIIPVHQITVSPKVGGLIKRLYFLEGDRVEKGKVLVELEDDNYRYDRDRAKGALEEAERQLQVLTTFRDRETDQALFKLEEAKAQMAQLESDLRRSERLRSGKVLDERDYELAKASYEAMDRRVKQLKIDYEFLRVKGPRDINIQAAQARIDQARAELANRQWQLDNCTIRAPISGTILTKIAEEGNIVNQLSLNLKGSICDMADLSDIEVDLTIQERDVAKVYKGQRCRVRSEAFPDRVYDGHVSRLMPSADRAKGAVPVRVKVNVPKDEEGVYLKPDMGVIVSFFKTDDKKKDDKPTKK